MYQPVDQYDLNGPSNKCFKKTGEGDWSCGWGEVGMEPPVKGKGPFFEQCRLNQAFSHSQDEEVHRVESVARGTGTLLSFMIWFRKDCHQGSV